MGRYIYTWRVHFYGTGGFTHNMFVEAKNRQDAINEIKRRGIRIIEMISCEWVDRW